MIELQKKYARMILKTCLVIKENQPLFISANSEVLPFVRIVANEAYKLGVKDIYFDIVDSYLKHDMLKNLDFEDLKKSNYFNKSIWNEYAKKGASFLMLASEMPGLMNDIDKDLQSKMFVYGLETREYFEKMREKSMIPWCICAAPTLSWAKKVFKNSHNPLDDMWNIIFKICGVDKDNPEEELNQKLNNLSKYKDKLNSYKIKKLIYKNKLGTNFEIELPTGALWVSGREKLVNGDLVLVNFPTEEVFTSPNCESANGIVYSSKPLSYQDSIIDKFWIKFENGIVVDYGAEEGYDSLKSIIESCEGSNRLGEVALVPFNSPISNSNIVFYETLYDENASCHLALGDSFPECIDGGKNLTKEELRKLKLNQSTNHVDFMIGTDDLNIVGITENDERIDIFINGNYSNIIER